MADEDCANPLLLGWVKEWLDQARMQNSKSVTVYKKAYDSLKACPLTFNHPSEAQQLSGFGPKLCDRLTQNLKNYCDEHGLPMPERPQKVKANNKRAAKETGNGENRLAKRTRKLKPYVPTLRSGPYGLVMGLSTLDEDASIGLTKAELIELAQPYTDASFTAPPDPTKYYTAWNSMKTLIQKDLVYEHGRPTRRYLLTEEGWETAKRIRNALQDKIVDPGPGLGNARDSVPSTDRGSARRTLERTQSLASNSGYDFGRKTRSPSIVLKMSDDDKDVGQLGLPFGGQSQTTGVGLPFGSQRQATESIIPNCDNTHNPFTLSGCTPIILPPGSFTIELVLDVREIRTKTDRDYIANELERKGITPIVRSLELGDTLWVAKCKDPAFLTRYGETSDEIMLDWIIERKRLDDLIASIKDGRFHEQKFRLRRSGVKNVTYLVEEFGVADSTGVGGRYQEAVSSAIASTQVVNGYFVKKTKNLDDSIRYLARMTTLLRNMYTGGTTSPQTPICLIPTNAIDSHQTYLDLLTRFRAQSPNATFATTMPTFSSLSSKSGMLTLRDVFLKMLMCTRGVTGDKALEIQRCWPTPRAFVEAFEEVYRRHGRGEAGRKVAEEMVSSRLGGLVGRKKIGKALSKKIAEVWGPV